MTTRADGGGAGVLADPAGEVADDDQRQRPAAGDVVGGRREVDARARRGSRAPRRTPGRGPGRPRPRRAARGSAPRRRRTGRRTPSPAARRRAGTTRGEQQGAHGGHQRVSRRLGATGADHGAVALGVAVARRRRPGRARRSRRTASITACVDCWRGAAVDRRSTRPIGTPATYGAPLLLPQVTSTSSSPGGHATGRRRGRGRGGRRRRRRRGRAGSRPPCSSRAGRRPRTPGRRAAARSRWTGRRATTRPTRPSLLSTVMSGWTPALVPASMVTVRVNDWAGPIATTRAGTSA